MVVIFLLWAPEATSTAGQRASLKSMKSSGISKYERDSFSGILL